MVEKETTEVLSMSRREEKAAGFLDKRMPADIVKTITTCSIIMIIAILVHDGDHIRQALNWSRPWD